MKGKVLLRAGYVFQHFSLFASSEISSCLVFLVTPAVGLMPGYGVSNCRVIRAQCDFDHFPMMLKFAPSKCSGIHYFILFFRGRVKNLTAMSIFGNFCKSKTEWQKKIYEWNYELLNSNDANSAIVTFNRNIWKPMNWNCGSSFFY